MATIIVPPNGATASDVTLNDVLQAAPGVDLNGVPVFYEIDGNSTLKSLFIGYNIEVDIGYLATGSLRGTGNVTGAADPAVGNLPLLDNFGTLDINGSIGTSFSNDGTLNVSQGEKLALTGDVFSLGTISVAAGGELDVFSPKSAFLSQLTNNGTVKSSGPATTLQATTNAGTIDITAGTLSLAASVTGAGAIIVESGAKLDASAAASGISGTLVLKAGSTLAFSKTSGITATLQNPSTAAKLDLVDVVATSATVSNGKIVISTSGGPITLNETGLTPGAVLAVSSDGTGGSYVSLSSTPIPTPGGGGTNPGGASNPAVYRFFDRLHGTQFLTASGDESTMLQSSRPDLAYEGVGLFSVPTNASGAAPVYRFFDKSYGTHFYTSSAAEKDSVIASRNDLAYEGIGFYEHSTKQSGDVAVYRFFDNNYGTHFYTSSVAEKDNIIATRIDLVSEGVGFYAPSS